MGAPSGDGGPPARPLSKDEVRRIISQNLTGEFERLRGTPGYQLDPVPWDKAKGYIKTGTAESLGRLGRSPAGVVVYWRFRDKILTEYDTMGDYMECKVFGWGHDVTKDGRKKVKRPQTVERQVVWRENDFPYHLEDGIQHHNIWSTTPLSPGEVQEVIKEKRPGYECMTFINVFPLASIPSVWHAHVLSRTARKGCGAGGL